jgi:hypothetical protein
MKFTRVYVLVGLFAALGALAGCSSAPVAEEAPVEAQANNDAFQALTNSDPGAVVDNATPTYTADASTATHADTSPVSLGATSAGRAH